MLSWLKSVGDEVAVGDELVEIETDKANMVYEADTAGTLVEIVAEEGATLPIGEVIARVGEAGEADGAQRATAQAETALLLRPKRPSAEQADDQARAAVPSERRPRPPTADGRVKASPIARRIAAGEGTGPGARCRGLGRGDGSSRPTWNRLRLGPAGGTPRKHSLPSEHPPHRPQQPRHSGWRLRHPCSRSRRRGDR